MNTEQERNLIAGRILVEYQKHSNNGLNNWHEIAALKLHRQWDEYYTKRLGEMITEIQVQMKKQTESKWISVKDRLPEHGQKVLLYNKNEFNGKLEIRFGSKHIGHNEWYSSDAYEDEIFTITHWMPLPEPPANEKSDSK